MLFILIYILSYYLWIYFWQDHKYMLVLGGDMFQLIAPFIAFCWLFRAFKNDKNGDKYFWFFLSLGCFNYFVAQSIWNYSELIQKVSPPFPGIPDFFWMVQYILYFIAFLYKMKQIKNTYPMIRYMFDIIIFMTVAVTLSMHFIINPILSLSIEENSFIFTLVYVGYPIGDLGLLFGVISLFFLTSSISKKIFIPILLGFVLKVFSNSVYLYLVTIDQYSTGSMYDPLWSLSLLLIGFSGLNAKENDREVTRVYSLKRFSRLPFYFRVLLPYLSACVLFIVALMEIDGISGIFFGSLVAVILLIIRQVITLIINEGLMKKLQQSTNELETQVQKRTKELNEHLQALRESEKRYRSLVKYSPDMIAVIINGKFIYINKAGVKLLGASSKNEIIKKSLWEFVPLDIRDNVKEKIISNNFEEAIVEQRMLRLDGIELTIEANAMPILYKGQRATQLIVRDITERKKAEEEIKYLAYHDSLTLLPNRIFFHERLKEEVEISKENNTIGSIFFIDLDRFKFVNDSLGHEIGDKLLIEVARRLHSCVREHDMVSRLGGDEFTIILSQINLKECTLIAKRILKEIGNPYFIEEHEISVTPSIGISSFPTHGDNVEDLVNKADIAMYKAKEKGKNRFEFYDLD
jgi:diguanylate cyclase (GGDEF)-like protein/PAS domain S-box-containing protein